jgi:hypothetical protein
VIAIVAATAAPARGAPCDEEAVELRAHLDEEKRRTFRWNTAWAIAFGAAAATQLTLALTETNLFGEFDADYEDTLYVGASKATIGLLARVVVPLRVSVPAATGDACRDVALLRDALEEAGKRERRSFWLTHIGGTALNLAGAAILTYRRSFKTGAISFAISYPVGPASAYTQPRRSWHWWRERRASWTVQAGVAANDTAADTWTLSLAGEW